MSHLSTQTQTQTPHNTKPSRVNELSRERRQAVLRQNFSFAGMLGYKDNKFNRIPVVNRYSIYVNARKPFA